MDEGSGMSTADAGRKAPSLTGRFAAAIALTAGFYLLALGLAAVLLGLPVYVIATGHFNLWLTITGLVLGGSILWAIVPRRLPFHTPGVRVERASQPRLVALVEEEARAMGEEPPHDVYVTMEVNAAVTQAGRNRRVMIVGLPLLHVLSERGFRGVVAHELSHYAGGDTRLGPWIYRTRETIGRTIEALSDDDGDEWIAQHLVRLPMIWYGHALLRITAVISRRQEFAADACAAGRAGRDAHVAALRTLAAYAPAFDAYWQDDVAPALERGARPPIAQGFVRFAEAEPIREATSELLARELAERRTEAYDSHPALAERIAAVEHLPAGDPDDSGSASALLDSPAELELELLRFLFGAQVAQDTDPVRWEEIAERIYVPVHERLVRDHAWVLDGVTFGSLPASVDRLDATAERLRKDDRELDEEGSRDKAAAILAAGGILALRSHGWTVDALPGLPVVCRRTDVGVSPHQMVESLRSGDLTRERFDADSRELGIAEIALGEAAAVSASR
jgi:heat shock protein HtpX